MIALLSHIIGGGEPPALLGLLVPWLLSLPVCVGLTGKQLSLWKLSIAVSASQLLFHTLFVVGAPSHGPTITHHHMAHGAIELPPVDAALSPHAGMIAGPTMWLMHGLAALVTIFLVHSGERALLRLREVVALTIDWIRTQAVKVIVPDTFERHVARVFVSRCHNFSFHLTRSVLSPLNRRGPPAISAF